MRGRESGVETEASLTFLIDFERGKVSRAVTFLDRDEALEAAGLSE
jgi:ketosteroid isomerase-like protein